VQGPGFSRCMVYVVKQWKGDGHRLPESVVINNFYTKTGARNVVIFSAVGAVCCQVSADGLYCSEANAG
jgi:hypothetical protein